jgi:hypothetical protein
MTDKRTLQDPERQRLVQQQIMMNYQVQPSQVKEKKKSQLTAFADEKRSVWKGKVDGCGDYRESGKSCIFRGVSTL